MDNYELLQSKEMTRDHMADFIVRELLYYFADGLAGKTSNGYINIRAWLDKPTKYRIVPFKHRGWMSAAEEIKTEEIKTKEFIEMIKYRILPPIKENLSTIPRGYGLEKLD